MDDLAQKFESEIGSIRSEDELVRLKAAYLGKSGCLTERFKNLSGLPPEERPAFGAQVNQLKMRIETACRERQAALAREKLERKLKAEAVDVTLPGRAVSKGGLHPVLKILNEVEDIFREIGFSVHEGPEVETDFFNFEALNIPKDHPARDMQDTFYISPQPPLNLRGGEGGIILLRTHTSPVQIHVMKNRKPPIRMIAPGVVYRRDSDISHTPMFHQVEGLVVGEGICFGDLKGVVLYFFQRLFGGSLKVRFRPSYFPFTEPSAEVDIQCVVCGGKGKIANGRRSPSGVSDRVSGEQMGGAGWRVVSPPAMIASPCRLCKESGWLEVMGCGMVHPAVFEKVGYDAKKVTGFAFGMGIERLTMLKFGIPDIRLFFENDLRFLGQFA